MTQISCLGGTNILPLAFMDTYQVYLGSGGYRIGGASKLIFTNVAHHLLKVGILGCVMLFLVGAKVMDV
jgi:hypothetical protein